MADTPAAWYPTVMRDRADRHPPRARAAVSVLMYLYHRGSHGRGGRRDLLASTNPSLFNIAALQKGLSPGRYRLEWRSARGRVLRVRLFVVRPSLRPAQDPHAAAPPPRDSGTYSRSPTPPTPAAERSSRVIGASPTERDPPDPPRRPPPAEPGLYPRDGLRGGAAPTESYPSPSEDTSIAQLVSNLQEVVARFRRA